MGDGEFSSRMIFFFVNISLAGDFFSPCTNLFYRARHRAINFFPPISPGINFFFFAPPPPPPGGGGGGGGGFFGGFLGGGGGGGGGW